MKPVRLKLAVLAALGICAHAAVTAQTAGTTTGTYLDAGRIRAPHYPTDDMWWNPAKNSYAGIEFPKGDTTNVSGFASIQLSGVDNSGQVLAAANYDRNPGSDFQPGPVIKGDSAAIAANAKAWSKIWKISSASIDSFLNNRAAGRPGIPASILDWPAKGNTTARDASGALLTLNEELAPFVDANQDGVYNPVDGDYPKMKGSEMLWWIFNDQTTHPRSRTLPLGVQVAVSAYAYTTGTTADNMIFYEYDLLNRGATLTGFQFAAVADFDLGYPFNDMTGVDSGRRMILTYNGNSDITGPNRYAGAAIALMEQPGDSYSARGPVRNLNSFAVDGTTDGAVISQELAAAQLSRLPWNEGLDYECRSGRAAGTRNGRIATAPITLAADARVRYGTALMVIDSVGICYQYDFSKVFPTTDTAYDRYWHPSRITPPSNPVTVPGQSLAALQVYPVPTDGRLIVKAGSPIRSLRVTNALGATLSVPYSLTATGAELRTEALAPGVYHLRVHSGGSTAPVTTTFIRK